MIHYICTEGVGSPWVANELRQVELAGIPFVLHALRRPARISHEADWARKINDETIPVYPLPAARFAFSLVAAPLIFRAHYFSALGNAVFGERENWRARMAALAHFFVAGYWALNTRRQEISHIHAQWAHSGCSVALYGAWLLGVPFSFTGHAVDLFRQRVALRDKIRRADFVVCISEFHRGLYLENGADAEKLIIVYCGIDLTLFQRVRRGTPGPFTILAAGRLIEKKGFTHLIDACRMLKERGRNFRCIIGGSGSLEGELRRQIKAAGLAAEITITGEPLIQEKIPRFMAEGDVFCLPCVRARDDDVDGLPQLLMEAMACGLPAISTRLVGIPDLIIDQRTGILVAPGSSAELADALELAMNEPAKMEALVAEGHRHLAARFDIGNCLEPLLQKFRTALARVPAAHETLSAEPATGTRC